MNLLVTDKCTNHCPYCFASTEMGRTQMLNHLSRENIQIVLEFIRNNGPHFDLNIIGGEPFLYNDLGYLLEQLTNEPNFGNASIFTGGIFKIGKMGEIAPYAKKTNLLFNLNEKKIYRSEGEYALILKNIEEGLKIGIHTNIGFNIYSKEFNYQEILTVCHNFGVEQLRWTVACPQINPSPNLQVLYPSDYPIVSKKIMTFLEKAYEMKIDTYLDCPVPKCFFTEQELGRLSLIQPHVSSAIKACKPAIDILTDLTIIRCFALSEIERKKLTDFRKFEHIVNYFENNIDEQFTRPQLYEKCDTCEYATNKTCFGGCIVNTPQAINKGIIVKDIIKQAFAAINERNFGLAESLLLNLPQKEASISFLIAHLYYQKGNMSNAKRWAMMTINRSKTDDFKRKSIELLQNINN